MNGGWLLNALIFAVTLVLILRICRRDGRWDWQRGRGAFRFFTVQSNALCAGAALLMCLLPAQPVVWALKYVGTAAVTVTMLTVFLFLGPSMGTLKPLLTGSDLFMHLLTPLTALISFLLFERRGMSFPTALLGMVPVVLYGLWYLNRIKYAPAGKRWEDFYGFNKGGKWPVAFTAMMVGGFAVCMALMGLQNL